MDTKTAELICALSQTEEGRRTFAAMESEQQEPCIHCHKVWYSIHYRDGVCHSCQKRHLPGRVELARRATTRYTTLIASVAIVLIFVTLVLLR